MLEGCDCRVRNGAVLKEYVQKNDQPSCESSGKDTVDRNESENWGLALMINSGSGELSRARAELVRRCADV